MAGIPTPARGRERERERGETLVELMVTISILGVSVVAILGALWTTLRVADFNSKSSSADTVLRAFAETMKQGGSSDTYHYVPCTTAGGQVTYPAYTPSEPYANYTTSITKIRYLNGFSGDAPVWADSCPATDGGLQELTLKATGPTNDPDVRGTETTTIVKRDATQDLPRCEVIECTEETP